MVTLPRSVLVAVDFGSASARAVSIGGGLAMASGAHLRLLHAETLEPPPYFTSEQVDGLERQRDATRRQAEQFLTHVGQRQTATPFETVLDDWPPVEAILRASEAADVVVMGTHGRRGLSRWWLGLVAERVLRDIEQPLLIVRAEIPAPVESVLSRVLVHAAGSLVGTHALEYARTLAERAHGDIFDRRHDLIEPALEQARATMLVAAAPYPRTTWWLANYGEPLVRFCTVPILFVSEQEPHHDA
jgi:nucleotide-binding universal stress UspA family protein